MVAILYDIHGNRPALDAVLDHARGQGAERFVLGGDYSAFGAWPADCVTTLRGLAGTTWIRGNWERWQADPGALPEDATVQGAAAWARARLGTGPVEELAAPQAPGGGGGPRGWGVGGRPVFLPPPPRLRHRAVRARARP